MSDLRKQIDERISRLTRISAVYLIVTGIAFHSVQVPFGYSSAVLYAAVVVWTIVTTTLITGVFSTTSTRPNVSSYTYQLATILFIIGAVLHEHQTALYIVALSFSVLSFFFRTWVLIIANIYPLAPAIVLMACIMLSVIVLKWLFSAAIASLLAIALIVFVGFFHVFTEGTLNPWDWLESLIFVAIAIGFTIIAVEHTTSTENVDDIGLFDILSAKLSSNRHADDGLEASGEHISVDA